MGGIAENNLRPYRDGGFYLWNCPKAITKNQWGPIPGFFIFEVFCKAEFTYIQGD